MKTFPNFSIKLLLSYTESLAYLTQEYSGTHKDTGSSEIALTWTPGFSLTQSGIKVYLEIRSNFAVFCLIFNRLLKNLF